MNLRLNYAVLAAAVVVAPLTTFHAVKPDASAASIGASLASTTAFCMLLHYEWKRDRRAAAAFLFFVFAMVLVGAGTVWTIAGKEALPFGIALAALALTVWTAVVLWREHSFNELLPSWLDETFPGAPMFEDDGVQWIFERLASPAEAPQVRVHLQNNIEATRTVELRLADESGFAMRGGALQLPGTFSIELAPRAHASVVLPVRWEPNHKSTKARLYCFVNARGAAAPRNRRQRAHPGPRPTSKVLVVLGPLAGHFVTDRGGVYVELARPTRLPPPVGPLLPRVELLERPPLVAPRGPSVTGHRGRV